MHPHLTVANQGTTAFVHEFHRILNGEYVPGFIAIDPVDHCGKSCAFPRSSRSCDQDEPLGSRRQFGQHRGKIELFQSQDCLWNEPQHHGWPPQRVEQVDADTHEGKRVGSVKLLFSQKSVDLLRRKNLV